MYTKFSRRWLFPLIALILAGFSIISVITFNTNINSTRDTNPQEAASAEEVNTEAEVRGDAAALPSQADLPTIAEHGHANSAESPGEEIAATGVETATSPYAPESFPLAPLQEATLPFDAAAIAEQSRHRIQLDSQGQPYVTQTSQKVFFVDGGMQFIPLSNEAVPFETPVSDTLNNNSKSGKTMKAGQQNVAAVRATVIPTPTLETTLTLFIQLQEITIAETPLFTGPTSTEPEIDGNVARFSYEKGITEELVVRDAGIEQRWEFATDPGITGDLRVGVDVTTPLTVALHGDGFYFYGLDEAGEVTPAVQYGRALAIDAAGHTQWATLDVTELSLTDSGERHYRLEITVAETWISQAQYPLLIDPLVSGLLRLEQAAPAHDQQSVEVAYNPDDDEYLLVWQDYRNGTDWGIYGQRVSAEGALLGENFVIADGLYNQLEPHLAYGSGAYLVTWRHYPSASTTYYYPLWEIVTGDGEVLEMVAGDIEINPTEQRTPTDVIYNSMSGQFLVLWQDLATGYWNVWGQHLTPTGAPVSLPIQISTLNTKHEDAAAGAYNPVTNEYLIVWRYRSSPSANGDVRGRRVTGGGVVSSETIQIGIGTARQEAPDVAYAAAAGKYAVIWQDDRYAGTNGYDIYGRLVNSNGSLTGNSEYVIAANPAVEQNARLAPGLNGQLLVVWQQENGTAAKEDPRALGSDLSGRFLGANGLPSGNPLTILTTEGNQQEPVLAVNEAGDFLLAWQGDQRGTQDIYGGLRLADGQWQGDWLAHPAQGSQEHPQAVYNPDGDEYLVVWQDYRSGVNWNVYGQRVSASGQLLGANIAIAIVRSSEESLNHQLEPRIAYGDNIYLVVWQQYVSSSSYKIVGQRISALGELVGTTLSFNRFDELPKEQPTDLLYNTTAHQFLVLSQYEENEDWNIWGWPVSPAGIVGTPLQITSATASETNAVGDYNVDDDQYLVVYELPGLSFNHDLQGRRINGNGTVITTDAIAITSGAADERASDVVYLPSAREYVVVWQGTVGPLVGNYNIYGRLITDDGALDGEIYTVAAESTEERLPRLALDNNTGAVLVWQRDTDETTGFDLYGRRLGSDGQPVGSNFVFLSAPGNQERPVLANNSGGTNLVVWQDEQTDGRDLYAALLRPDELITGLVVSSSSPTVWGESTLLDSTITGGNNVAYVWDFGDGSPAENEPKAKHLYVAPGVYTATVTASNEVSQVTASTTVIVAETITGLQVVNDSPTLLGTATTLTATVTAGSDVSYTWDWGDGTSPAASSAVVSHTYPVLGYYTATVRAENAVSQQEASTMVTAYVTVTAAFTATPRVGVAPLTVTFSSLSNGATGYQWDLGDGATATAPDLTHVYSQTGRYTVTLTATGPGGTDASVQPDYITVFPTWQFISTDVTPPARGEYGLAYDSEHDVVILYGGSANGWPYENSTWEFDGVDWTPATTTHRPNAVYGMSMVYDSSRQNVMLFGGSNSSDDALAETWTYSGTEWTQLTLVTSPPARTNTAIVYSNNSQTVYLFGGHSTTTYYNDLWQFDGSAWSQVLVNGESPPARTLHGLAYDSHNHTLLLFGGRSAAGAQLADTWIFEFATHTWREVVASGPGGRQAHALIYDPAQDAVVLVGGVTDDGDTWLNDTWHFQNEVWLAGDPAPTTSGIAYHKLIYDSAENACLLFANGETWQYR